MDTRQHRLVLSLALVPMLGASAVLAGSFEGGGGSLLFGTGAPNSVDAASDLANDLGVDDETGNYVLGIQGFYQGDRARLGGAFQAHAWGGVDPGHREAGEGAAGVAAFVGGLYGTYTFRRDRVLLNLGGVVGAGRCILGFSLDDGRVQEKENVAAFYLEPHVSMGVATSPYFAIEFQLSAPIFLLTDDLVLTHENATYTVAGSDMTGVSFSAKLTFGRVADP